MHARLTSPLCLAAAAALAGVIAAFPVALLAISSVFHSATPAQAAAGAGAVTGQVMWCVSGVVGVPGPLGASGAPGTPGAPGASGAADGAPGGAAPDASPPAQGAPTAPAVPAVPAVPEAPDARGGVTPGGVVPFPIRPPFPRFLPAGAVLVAVQGTGLSARTDENGRFRIDNVPSGQYWTIAAGPVRGATAAQPNVVVADAGQTVDMGRLTLGTFCGGGPVPYAVPGANGAPDTGAGGMP